MNFEIENTLRTITESFLPRNSGAACLHFIVNVRYAAYLSVEDLSEENKLQLNAKNLEMERTHGESEAAFFSDQYLSPQENALIHFIVNRPRNYTKVFAFTAENFKALPNIPGKLQHPAELIADHDSCWSDGFNRYHREIAQNLMFQLNAKLIALIGDKTFNPHQHLNTHASLYSIRRGNLIVAECQGVEKYGQKALLTWEDF